MSDYTIQHMKYFLTIIFGLLTGIVHAQTGVIKGRVFNGASNEPIPFASIILTGTTIGSTSDLEGNFIFTGVKPGFYKLTVSSVGYEMVTSDEFQVTNAKTSFTDIPLEEKTIKIEDVVVKPNSFRKVEESPVALKSIGIKEIEKSPGANRDISKVIQVLPGVASGVSYRNDLIVRGGGPSENRFLLDGIEIPNLNHFGTQGASGGSVGIINSDFLREVDFFTGAFPANRGNVLSSVLDMKLIEGNPEKMVYRTTIGASEFAVSASGPLSDKTSLLFSARRSYLQFLFQALKLPFLPTFNDYTLKVKTKFDKKNELTFLSIGSLDKSVLNTGIKDPSEEQQYILNYLPSYDQWTYAIGAVYRHYRDNSYDTWVLSRNMLNNESAKFENNEEKGNPLLQYVSQEIENKFRYENTWRKNDYKIVSGAGLEYVKYTNDTYKKVFIPEGKDTINSVSYNSFLKFLRYNVFLQASRTFMESRLTLSAGVRLDGNSYSSVMANPFSQFSPRASVSFGLTGKWYLNGNLGRFYQVPSYTTLGYRSSSGTLVNKINEIRYIRSDHLVAGIEYRKSENSRISVEGFLKMYNHYPFSLNDSVSLASKGADYGVYGDEPVVSTSSGRAYGLELYYRDQLMDFLNVILSYTFVRSEFEDKTGKLIPSAWDNRHILNLTASAEFGRNWNFGAKWRFVGGAPFTPYDFDRSSLKTAWDARGQGYPDFNRFNTGRLKNFQELDLRIDKEFYFKKWSLNLYFDVQNAYNYKSKEPDVLVLQRDANGNPLSDPADPAKYRLKYLPSESGTVLPTLGIIVEF
jgi:outer membrane receptor for ferrienterochelin and colicin